MLFLPAPKRRADEIRNHRDLETANIVLLWAAVHQHGPWMRHSTQISQAPLFHQKRRTVARAVSCLPLLKIHRYAGSLSLRWKRAEIADR